MHNMKKFVLAIQSQASGHGSTRPKRALLPACAGSVRREPRKRVYDQLTTDRLKYLLFAQGK